MNRASKLSLVFGLVPFAVRAVFLILSAFVAGGPEGTRFLIEGVGAWGNLLVSLVFGVLAIVVGARAVAQKRRESQPHPMATAGIVLGVLNLLGVVVTLAYVFFS
jgi:hypothetical protein